MRVNEGLADRVIRVAVGLLILASFFVIEGNARWLSLIGFVPLLTGVAGYCPLYTLLGMSTCPLEKTS